MIRAAQRVCIAVYPCLKEIKEQVCEQVRKCIDLNEVLTIARRRLFCKSVWAYMLAYSILHNSDKIRSSEGVDNASKTHMMAGRCI